jgi:hypothetical protein
MKNYKLFTFSLFLSVSAFADTNLATTAPATKKQVEKAAEILKEASALDLNDKSRAVKITKARKLTEDRSVVKKIAADLICDGAKQFENDEYVDNPTDCCYKGEVADAKVLVETAVFQSGKWEWDEYKVSKVSTRGQNLEITIHDGPNNEDNSLVASKCQN